MIVRYYLWMGTDFVTYIALQSGTVAAFTSLYVAPLLRDFGLKERVWEHGAIQSSRELATGFTRSMALRSFHTTSEHFKAWAANEAHQDGSHLHIQTHSPLKWRIPTPGERVTALRPTEAYFSGSVGLPRCSFEPGDVGVIASINIPAVRHTPENPSDLFACADFEKPGVNSFEGPGQCTWRCNLYYHHIIALPSISKEI